MVTPPVWLTVLVAGLVLAVAAGIARADEPERRDESPASLPCQDKPSAPAWLDRMQAGLYRTTCLAAARFDGLFGSERFDAEYQTSHGRLSVGALLSEHDHLEDLSRFRLHLQLPQFSGRLGVFIGQDDAEDGLGAREAQMVMHRRFGFSQDDDVLLGLGYRRPVLGGGVFDASVGTHFGSGFEPYVRGRYRVAMPLFERNVVKLNESVFWQEDLGAGLTSRLDVDRLLAQGLLARWTGSVTVATEARGLRWFTGATLYQSLGAGRALAWQVGASADNRRGEPESDRGLLVSYRRRILRDWMFLELRSGVSWPRESSREHRVRNLACGLLVEMWFGKPAAREG